MKSSAQAKTATSPSWGMVRGGDVTGARSGNTSSPQHPKDIVLFNASRLRSCCASCSTIRRNSSIIYDSEFVPLLPSPVCAQPTRMRVSTFTSAIVKILYGLDVAEKNDKYIAMMARALEGGEAFVPGKYYVEFLPFLRHIPAWVPGAGFQKDFARWRHAAEWVRSTMVEKTKEGMVRHPVSLCRLTDTDTTSYSRRTVGRPSLLWRS